MKSSQFLEEGFVEDAHSVHLDHEVQMARADCFHAAEDALALHKLLRSIDEQQGLEGWVAAKITLASDYLKTVREYLEYELMTGGSGDVEGNEAPMSMPETLASPIETAAAPISPALPVAEDAVDDFLAKGGKIQYGKSHKPRKSEKTDYGSRHIGGMRDATAGKAGKTLGRAASTNFKGTGKAVVSVEGQLAETSAGSVATVVNPTPKNKAKVGSLFGGTYKQTKAK